MRVGRNWDYRLICDCQKHARRRRVFRLMQSAARHVQRRAVALVIAIPLAFCAFGFPTDAMNAVSLPLMDARGSQPANFHIFTTRKSREVILQPEAAPKNLSLDLAK